MKTVFILLGAILLFFSCKKEFSGADKPNTTPVVPKEESSLTVTVDGKTYQLPVVKQEISFADTAIVKIMAVAPQITIELQAMSTSHAKGVGNYFLWCCRNKGYGTFSGAYDEFDGIQSVDVGNIGTQKGSLSISTNDAKGYAGTFALTGKDTLNVTKDFTGSFKIIY